MNILDKYFHSGKLLWYDFTSMKQKVYSFIGSLVSVCFWFFIALDTFFVFVLIGILSLFDRNQRISHHIANVWGKLIIRANPFWKLTISGSERIKKNKAYVLVANHASLADIVCLYCLGKPFKWLAKKSLFRIPFFGWTMSLLRYIPLERGRHGSIRDSFQTAQEWLEKGVSVLIFPEGTRSRSGELGEFKNGAFKLAIRAQKPIVPIVLWGTFEAISKGKMTMAGAIKGRIQVLHEVDTAGYKEEEHEALKKKVWELMNQELNKID